MSTPTLTPSPASLSKDNIHIHLTYSPLNILATLSHIRTPKAGALTSFIGTTRDTFDERAVATLHYTAYTPRALQTLYAVGKEVLEKHGLLGIAIVHRLGEVAVGEESVHVCVASAHRGEGWRGGEEALELVKERAEVWKREVFVDGEGEWRENFP